MTDHPATAGDETAPLPPDDLARTLTVSDPEDPALRHLFVSGGTYTILISGGETGGRYCLIDMLVTDGSGPPPHRHDFEKLFTLSKVSSISLSAERPGR